MFTIYARPLASPTGNVATHCPLCGKACRLNEIVRSVYHVLGCVRCYVAPETERS